MPLPWVTFRLKAVGWSDLALLFLLIFWITAYLKKYKNKFQLGDMLLQLIIVIVTFILVISAIIFADSSYSTMSDKIISLMRVDTYVFFVILILFEVWWLIERYKKKGRITPTDFDIPVMVFLLACMLSFINSKAVEQSLFMFKGILAGAIIFYLLNDRFLNDRKALQKFVYFFLAGATLTAAIGLLQYTTGWPKGFIGVPGVHYAPAGDTFYARISSTMQHPNILGQLLVLAFFTNLGIILEKKDWLLKKAYNYISSAIIILCLIFTYSRSAWLACILGLIALLILKFKENKKVLITIVIILLVAGALLYQPVLDRIKSSTGDDLSIVSRLEAWKSSWLMFKDYPLTGMGLNTFFINYSSYKTPGAPFLMADAHNTFINLAVETGILGLASFFWILVLCFKTCFKKSGFCLALGVAVFALLIAGMFENLFFDTRVTTLMWVFFALISAYGTKKIHLKT